MLTTADELKTFRALLLALWDANVSAWAGSGISKPKPAHWATHKYLAPIQHPSKEGFKRDLESLKATTNLPTRKWVLVLPPLERGTGLVPALTTFVSRSKPGPRVSFEVGLYTIHGGNLCCFPMRFE